MAENPKGNPPAPVVPGPGEAPASVAAVMKGKTAKMPAQVNLEKAVSRLEDRVGGLESWRGAVDSFLADVLPSSDAVAKAKTPPGFDPGPRKGILDELAEDLGFGG